MKQNNRAVKRYCRGVRSWLPGGKMRRVIMNQIQETVGSFVLQNPDADYDAIQAQFGTPKDIAVSYLDAMDSGEILRGLRIRRRVLTVVIATALMVLVTWASVVTWAIYDVKQYAKDTPYIEVLIE